MTAILGGLGAAALWAAATLCSSRSSRMVGSRVVLAWIMIVGVAVGIPVAAASPAPATVAPSTLGLLLLAGDRVGVTGQRLVIRFGQPIHSLQCRGSSLPIIRR